MNLARKAESVTDKESYIDFRLRLLGEPGEGRFLNFNFFAIIDRERETEVSRRENCGGLLP